MSERKPPGGGRLFPSAGNVVDLGSFRALRQMAQRLIVFHLTDIKEETPASLPGARTVDIQSLEALSSALLLYRPDCIIVDSRLSWGEPFALIKHLTHSHQAPVIMLFDESEASSDMHKKVKRAYASGVSDTFFGSVCQVELAHSLRILLSMRDGAAESLA